MRLSSGDNHFAMNGSHGTNDLTGDCELAIFCSERASAKVEANPMTNKQTRTRQMPVAIDQGQSWKKLR
jgi:hypothetical protein